MALAAAKAEGLLGDRPRDCTSFPSGPRSGIRVGSGPAFPGLEPAATGQRAGGRLFPSPSLGGASHHGPHGELSHKYPPPPHSLAFQSPP